MKPLTEKTDRERYGVQVCNLRLPVEYRAWLPGISARQEDADCKSTLHVTPIIAF